MTWYTEIPINESICYMLTAPVRQTPNRLHKSPKLHTKIIPTDRPSELPFTKFKTICGRKQFAKKITDKMPREKDAKSCKKQLSHDGDNDAPKVSNLIYSMACLVGAYAVIKSCCPLSTFRIACYAHGPGQTGRSYRSAVLMCIVRLCKAPQSLTTANRAPGPDQSEKEVYNSTCFCPQCSREYVFAVHSMVSEV